MNSIKDFKLDLKTFNEVMLLSASFSVKNASNEEMIFTYFNFRQSYLHNYTTTHTSLGAKVIGTVNGYDIIETSLLDTEKEFFGL